MRSGDDQAILDDNALSAPTFLGLNFERGSSDLFLDI